METTTSPLARAVNVSDASEARICVLASSTMASSTADMSALVVMASSVRLFAMISNSLYTSGHERTPIGQVRTGTNPQIRVCDHWHQSAKMTRVRVVALELSSRLVHPACPTGGSAILALIAAVGILVFAPAAVAESPCMPWEVYRPILRMCEAKTDTSAQPAALSKVGLRERGRTPPSVQETARPKVVVRERGRTQHSVEKPERPKVVRPERGRTQHSVREPASRKVAVRERGRTHSVRQPRNV